MTTAAHSPRHARSRPLLGRRGIHHQTAATAQRQAGFTLVEMAVVLVIIGVILGAVMIGRDAQRNAEYLRIRQTFINQWAVAYNTYVQRMGVPPGDNLSAPRLMVNGQQYTGVLGGNLSAVAEPPALCQGTLGRNMQRTANPRLDLRAIMLQAGVELPAGRGLGMEDRYVYRDTNGNPQELQVCFQWNRPGRPFGSGNVMVISGLTPDLARSLASAIKGNADANSGSFRQEGVAVGADGGQLSGANTGIAGQGIGNTGGVDWVSENTQTYTATRGAVAGSTVNDSRDTQVRTVVAHYRMNQ